ncbi:MAG: dihydrofolate reductase family protein [Deinococcota bacterium]|jgi:dihydrofolate reductase|nr:dihydrofolate reductase family protein [Deinococcota bacterium]
MGKVILGMTISLDGYINDSRGSVGALYHDLATLPDTEPLKESIQNTGAVVMGRNTFAMAKDPDDYAGNYEFQVPIFVLTHEVPEKHPKETPELTFTFVTDGLESALRQARVAAGDKDVSIVGGADVTRRCLQAGLADELHIDIMSVLLGGGLRLFEDTGTEQLQLERIKVVELPAGRTHLKFRVVKSHQGN